jgi:hypothetical protein
VTKVKTDLSPDQISTQKLLWQFLGKNAVIIKSVENSTISGKYRGL